MSSAYFLLLMLSVFFSCHGNKNLAFSIKDHNSLESTGNNTDVDILGNYTPQSNFIAAVTTNKGFMFSMEVLVGTPPVKLRLALDIGSDLTWIECYPTQHSNPLDRSTFYSRVESTSFRHVPASHHLCDRSKGYGSGRNGRCAYEIYKDPSDKTIRGFLARDMFHLESSMAVSGLVFGCSDNNDQSIFEYHEDINGVFGLGNGDLSLPSQFRGVVEDKFAYCVPRKGGQSYLRFGSDIPLPPHNAKVVPMVNSADPTLKSKYPLKLLGVIVDGRQLNLQHNYECVIDTRSRNTRIPATIHMKLVPEIDRYLGSRGVKRAKKTRTCYYTPPGFADYPTVSLNIGGATLDLRGEQLFYLADENHDRHMMCFGMLRDQPSIFYITIGVMQQMHTSFIFDLRARHITFGTDKDCANF